MSDLQALLRTESGSRIFWVFFVTVEGNGKRRHIVHRYVCTHFAL